MQTISPFQAKTQYDVAIVGSGAGGGQMAHTLTLAGLKVVTALADVILPEDKYGPAASALRVPDFIDEWVSAPYPRQQTSRKTILPGLKWMNEESRRRHGKNFPALLEMQKRSLCDDLSAPGPTNPGLKKVAVFFSHFTSLCMGAYYGTPDGWKAIGYVGNTPLGSFDGPPQALLDKLGLVQTVK